GSSCPSGESGEAPDRAGGNGAPPHEAGPFPAPPPAPTPTFPGGVLVLVPEPWVCGEKRCPGMRPAGHLLCAGARVSGSPAVGLFPSVGYLHAVGGRDV